jgi:hypothetical protein
MKYICPIGKDNKCDGTKVNCPHIIPHERIETCNKGICSRLSPMSNTKNECVEIEE